MATTTALARIEAQSKTQDKLLSMAGGFGTGTKEVLLKAMDTPIALVLTMALVEYLQTVQIKYPVYAMSSFPGVPDAILCYNRKPLLSQGFATTIEGVIISKEVLSGLGGLGGIGGLIGIIAKMLAK